MAKEWSKEHARFIGRIIFADFLEYPLSKYKNFIETVKTSSFFNKLAIKEKRLSKAKISSEVKEISSKVVAEIVRCSKGSSIRYTYEGFNKVYTMNDNSCILYKLRRISSRNELTHRILKGIIEHQREYLKTGDPIDLVPFSQVQLPVDNSWVSRLVNGLSVIIPSGEEKPLKWFFQTQRQINKRLIKKLLDKENEDLQSGKLKKPYTDNEIRLLLEDRLRSRVKDKGELYVVGRVVGVRCEASLPHPHYSLPDTQPITHPHPDVKQRNGHSAYAPSFAKASEGKKASADRRNPNRLPSLSRWTVGHCRKDMGIPSFKRRLSGYKYPPISANFSMLYPLALEEVLKNAPASPGIYELRLKGEEIEYSKGKTNVIYIGRTMNIKKRLREHLGRKSKNHHIKGFLKKEKCLFRYILLRKDWRDEEKKLYKLFVATYGSAPKCNRVRP